MNINTVFNEKSILITGGTGSLGKTLVHFLLKGTYGTPRKIIVFSRDEAKQHYMRFDYSHVRNDDEYKMFNNFKRLLQFRIGDVRNYSSISEAMRDIDIVINAAALKQVPSCEYFPLEACYTNVIGANNIVSSILEHSLPVETVVGISTDKACLPVNTMGITKALQERVFISGNIRYPSTRFICVRYGNVLASRGSVIPLFHNQIKNGGPVTITTEDMTRFLLPLSSAVNIIVNAIASANPGEIYVPKIQSALIINIAKALIGQRNIPIEVVGIRPGEKIHELMISQEEGCRAYKKGLFYAISPMLPELSYNYTEKPLGKSYTSNDTVMSYEETEEFLKSHNLMVDNSNIDQSEHELLA